VNRNLKKEGIMKLVLEIPRKTLYLILSVFLIAFILIPVLLYLGPQNARAEWNSDNTSTSDSYTLSDIEGHLENLVRQLEKLNYNLDDIEDELEKIRGEM
jgi:hypothetical protein